MPPLHLLLLVFLLGCATGGLFVALLRRHAIEQIKQEFEQQLSRPPSVTPRAIALRPDSGTRAYDA